MSLASHVYAQSAPAAPSTTPKSANAEPIKSNVGIEEIVVTARKTTENLQKVPISMSAVSPRVLENATTGGVSTFEALSSLVPNLKIFKDVNTAGSYATYIRGLGRDNGAYNVENPVAVYVDDVIYPFQNGPVLDVGAISNVEVLRGPQGTLYGRSATVGAIKYTTQHPNLNDIEAGIQGTAGSYGLLQSYGGISVPIISGKLAVRLDAGDRVYDGYEKVFFNNGAAVNPFRIGGQDGQEFRTSLLWQPAKNLEVYAKIDGERDRDEKNQLTSEITTPTAPATVTPSIPQVVTTRYGGVFHVAIPPNSLPQGSNLDVLGGQINVSWTPDGGPVLKSITSYRENHQTYVNDTVGNGSINAVAAFQDNHTKTFTQEFQATGNLIDGRLKYVTGLFYLHDDQEQDRISPPAVSSIKTFMHQLTNSYGIYGDATYNITDALSVSVGGRYSRDEKEADTLSVGTAAAANFNVHGSGSWDRFTPHVALNYQYNQDILFYTSYAQGYKSGSLGNAAPTTSVLASVFVPFEHSTDYEVGVKSSWFDRRLIINFDYFWTYYLNTATAVNSGPTSFLVIENLMSQGPELEITARPTHEWRFGAELSKLDAKYFRLAPPSIDPTVNALSDLTPKESPKYNVFLHSEYTFDNLSIVQGSLEVGGDVNFVGQTYECLAHAAACVQNPYSVVGLHADYTFPDRRYQLVLAGTNITDTRYFKVAGAVGVYYMAPSEVSVTLKFRL